MAKKLKERSAKTSAYWTYPDLHRAAEIAVYYGFMLVSAPSIEKQDKDHAKSFKDDGDCDCIQPEEKISFIRSNFEDGVPSLPLMLAYERGGRKDKKIDYSLDIIGTPRSIADGTVIKTAYEICRSEGYEDIVVEINSVGDRDSLNRFSRELTSYFRKNIGALDAECRQLFKKGVCYALTPCDHEKCKPIKDAAPRSMNFLSEPSRVHFMEVLNLLETTGIPYAINSNLIEHTEFASHILFKIVGRDPEKKDSQILASGARWSGLARKIGLKKDVPGVSATVYIKKQTKQEAKTKKIKRPQFYFIQMGQEAKLKSLYLIEILRQAKIPVYHSLTKDKLTIQLASAEHLRVPYILIMGQKESLENTVLIREMNNRSQETVRLADIADYLRKLLD